MHNLQTRALQVDSKHIDEPGAHPVIIRHATAGDLSVFNAGRDLPKSQGGGELKSFGWFSLGSA
jgi:hypothetical protein